MSNTHIDIQQIYWAKKHKNLHRSPPHEKQEVKFILNNLVRIVGFYNFVKNRTMSHQTGIKGKEIFQQYGNQIYLSFVDTSVIFSFFLLQQMKNR